MGGVDAGFAFYVQHAKLTYGYNYVAAQHFTIESDGPIPEGDHVLSFEFVPTGQPDFAQGKGVPADIRLYVDGDRVGGGHLPVTIPLLMGLGSGVSIGTNAGSPVMPDFDPPFAFTGVVKKALVDVTGVRIEDEEVRIKAYLAAAMARQ
jgi:arylsulfatase